jgi:hypothetical protein
MAADHLIKSNGTLALLLLAGTAVGRAYALPQTDEAGGQAQDYDQVVVQMPVEQAPIASVAMARLMIVLHKARKQAALTLCNGNWTPGGEPIQQIGPLALTPAPEEHIWLYESLRRPRPLACRDVSRARFFIEMSRHLPAWISVRPAGQAAAFRRGVAVSPHTDAAFASR